MSFLLLIQFTLMYSTPLIYAAMGGVVSERSGVINLGLEGLMTIGAFAGAAAAYFTGSPWIGLLVGGLSGATLALALAFAAVTLKADQTITGIALNLIAPALAVFLCRLMFDDSTSTKPLALTAKLRGVLSMAGADNADSPLLQTLNINISTIIALFIAAFLFFFLYKTKHGLRLIGVGEHPGAADSLGVSVAKTRYAAVITSGFLAGLGGVSASIGIVTSFQQTTISGQGFIALAAVIFGKWSPHGALAACLLFGAAQSAVILLGGQSNINIPSQFISMTPYILTLATLVLFIGRSNAPKADGIPFEKGSH